MATPPSSEDCGGLDSDLDWLINVVFSVALASATIPPGYHLGVADVHDPWA